MADGQGATQIARQNEWAVSNVKKIMAKLKSAALAGEDAPSCSYKRSRPEGVDVEALRAEVDPFFFSQAWSLAIFTSHCFGVAGFRASAGSVCKD